MTPDIASRFAAPALPTPTPGRTNAHAVAEEFEAVFLSSMLSQMFAGVPTDGPFGGGQAEETYRGLLIEQYGKEIAAGGGIGIADHVARELLRLQEASNA